MYCGSGTAVLTASQQRHILLNVRPSCPNVTNVSVIQAAYLYTVSGKKEANSFL